MKEKLIKNKYIWVAFFIALIPRLLFLIKTYPISVTGDEMFAMWPAAKILGYDWSGVMQNYRYYGYGYTVLWIPFMALIKNPVILYRSMTGLMALCQALVAPISFHLMKRYFHVTDEKLMCLISVTCSYLVAVRATYTYPEFVYVLAVWLIVWAMLKLATEHVQRQKRAKALHTGIVFATLAYAYTVHSRALALWGALILTFVLYVWIYRKSFLSLPVCILVGIPAFFAVRAGIDRVLAFLEVGQNGSVSNTTARISIETLKLFQNPKTWTAWADIIIGELNESVVLTGGIAVAIVVAMCMMIWRALRREETIVDGERQAYLPYILTGIFCICAIAITIGGQSLIWLGGVARLITNNESGDSFRAITYLRYYAAYIGPLFMAGSIYLIQNTEIVEKIKGKILLITGLLQSYWVLVILPVLCYELGCVWSYAPFSLTRGFAAETVGIRSYLPGTVFIFGFMLLSYQLYRRKHEKTVIGMLCIVLIYTYLFNGFYHERYRGEQVYQTCRPIVEWIEKAEATGLKLDEIYVADDGMSATTLRDALEYQFLMPEKQIISGTPEQAEGAYLCHDSELLSEELEESATKFQIMENTYLYVWGDPSGKEQQTVE